MALFKIFKGNSSTLPKNYKDGYCYFTIDDGKMYIDTKDSDSTGRICLNAKHADTADLATNATNAQNADKLDGYHESSFLRHRKTTSVDGEETPWTGLSITEYHGAYPDEITDKIYDWGQVITLSGDNSRFELFTNHNSSTLETSNGIQYRSGWGDDKKPWNMILDSKNFNKYALPLTGGTLTGTLIAPKFQGALIGNADTATVATKLGTNAGDYCHPVYFAEGIPKICTQLKIGDNLHLFSDGEGGNIHFVTPDGNAYEIDNYNNNLRVYRNNGSQTWTFQKDGVFHSRGNLSSNDSLYLYKNNRTVGLQTDENGNSCWINWKDSTHWTQIGLINESVGTDNIVHIYRQNGSSSFEDYKLIHTGNWWNYCFGTPHWGNEVDFNTLVDTGWYNKQGLNINTPYGGDGTSIDTHFFIKTLHNSPTWIRQVAYDVRSERTYTRCQFDGTWYGWKQYLLGDIANPCNFYINTGNYSAHLEVSNNTSRGVCLRADTEGGNINIYSGNGHTNFWEIDSYNGDLRFYTWRESDGNYSGAVHIGQENGCLYGAVWNDYAEYRNQEEEIEPGYIVISTKNGKVKKTTKHLSPFDGVVSDTFGFAIGENDECKTPLAVAGRVLVYCEGDRNLYEIGDVVCASENGKACKMTREEIREWPDRIVGTVSEIPDYETWGQSSVKVNDRIWIKVK